MKKYLFIIIIFNIFIINVYADEITPCEYSDEYLEWLKLPNEEKSDNLIPTICKNDEKVDIINTITSSSFSNLRATSYPSKYPTNGATNVETLVSGQTTSVKNQGTTGACWTFAAMATVESYILKHQNRVLDLSELHLEYMATKKFTDGNNPYGYNRTLDSGGNYFMSSAYFINNKGPINESAMPFTNNLVPRSLSSMPTVEPQIDINDISILSNTSTNKCSIVMETLKQQIMDNGGVGASMYYDKSYLQKTTNAYYNPYSSLSSNHAVTLVGWDDNYATSNYLSTYRPTSKGAWIVKNSYGTSWGDKGYFYVSYDDAKICSITSSILSVDDDFTDNYYNHAVLGYNMYTGFKSNLQTAYEAVTYTKKNNFEELTEVTVGSYFYSTVEIYLQDNTQTLSVNNATLITSGTIPYGGYKTFKLTRPILINSPKFSIIVKTTSPSSYPLTLSGVNNNFYKEMVVNENLSFYSTSGTSFNDLAKLDTPSIAPISVGTNNVSYAMDIYNRQSSYTLQYNTSSQINLDVISAGIPNGSSINYKVYNSSNNDVTSDFNFTNGTTYNNHTSIKFTNKTNASKDTYILKLSYGSLETSITFTISDSIKVTSIYLTNQTVNEGDTKNYTPVVIPSNATNKSLTYSTTNSDVATYNGSYITAKTPGTAIITARATDGSGVYTTFTVTVLEKTLTNSAPYTINNNIITNIKIGTSLTTFNNYLYPNSWVTTKIYNSKGSEITNGNVGTNYWIIKKYPTGLTKTYYLSVLGDVNGDSLINSGDLLTLRQHLLGKKKLTGAYYYSGLLESKKEINSGDLLKMRQYLLGKTKL